MVVGMETNEHNANNVSIVHSGNTDPNDIQFTNAYGANDPSECGVNELPITNTNPNSGIDGLGECIRHADINIQHKPSSQNMHCKQLVDDDENVQLPATKGAYVCGSIQGVCCPMTIDTAATYTVVSARVYYKIPKHKRPRLHQPGTAKQAGDGVVEILGKTIFDVEMG